MPPEETHPLYKDLRVWQQSIQFANQVIDITENMNTPQKHYRLVEQLEAAAASVPMNIAEGKGRHTPKDLIRFLYIARGSLYETMTLLDIFSMRGWITQETYTDLETKSNQIAKMLHALIASIRRSSP